MVNKFPTFSSSSLSFSGFLRVESLCVAEDVGVLGLKEVLLLDSVVGEFFLMVTWKTGYDRLFTRVLSEFTNSVAKTSKIQLHWVKTFTVVQSNLKTTIACANTFEIVFFDGGVYNVLAPRDLLENVRLCLWRQISNHKIYDLWSGILSACVVFETWVASDEVVAGEESLLDSFRLVTVYLHNLDSAGCWRGVSLELDLIYVGF